MKTKEFKGIISQSATKDNSLILNAIEHSCIPFNSWFETHSRLYGSRSGNGSAAIVFNDDSSFLYRKCNRIENNLYICKQKQLSKAVSSLLSLLVMGKRFFGLND